MVSAEGTGQTWFCDFKGKVLSQADDGRRRLPGQSGWDWTGHGRLSRTVPGAGDRVSLAGTGGWKSGWSMLSPVSPGQSADHLTAPLRTQLIIPKSQPCDFPLLILGVLWTLVKMGFVRWHGGRGHGGPSLSLEPFISRVSDFLWRWVCEGRLWQWVSLW